MTWRSAPDSARTDTAGCRRPSRSGHGGPALERPGKAIAANGAARLCFRPGAARPSRIIARDGASPAGGSAIEIRDALIARAPPYTYGAYLPGSGATLAAAAVWTDALIAAMSF